MNNLMIGKPTLGSNDVIGSTYRLTPQITRELRGARSVGIAMIPSQDARKFMGFYGMKFADGAEKFEGLMKACGSPTAAGARQQTSDPFANPELRPSEGRETGWFVVVVSCLISDRSRCRTEILNKLPFPIQYACQKQGVPATLAVYNKQPFTRPQTAWCVLR